MKPNVEAGSVKLTMEHSDADILQRMRMCTPTWLYDAMMAADSHDARGDILYMLNLVDTICRQCSSNNK